MRFTTGLLALATLFCTPACGPAVSDSDEQALEHLLSHPSLTADRVSSTISSVVFVSSGGLTPHGPFFRIEFFADDTFVYEGLQGVPALGKRTGSFRFSELAAWLDSQPVTALPYLAGPGMVDGPYYSVVIKRSRGFSSHLSYGWPVEDVELWGLFQALTGLTFSLPGLGPGA